MYYSGRANVVFGVDSNFLQNFVIGRIRLHHIVVTELVKYFRGVVVGSCRCLVR